MPTAVPSTRHSGRDVLISVGLMIAACALMAGTTLLAKILGAPSGDNPLHPLQISAGRFVFASLALAPLIAWHRPSLRNTPWRKHAIRVVLGWAGVTCMFAASSAMRLADATAISFLNPIIAMVLAIPFLGERVGPWRWVAAATAFCGALILTEPGTDAFQPMALVALTAAVFLGAENILIKKLVDTEPQLRILTISNFFGAFLAMIAAAVVWRAPLPGQWLLLAALGVTMLCVQVLYMQALKRGDASFVTPLFYTTLIFAGLYDYLVFSEWPAVAGFVGASLIILGALTIAWREQVQRRKQAAGHDAARLPASRPA